MSTRPGVIDEQRSAAAKDRHQNGKLFFTDPLVPLESGISLALNSWSFQFGKHLLKSTTGDFSPVF